MNRYITSTKDKNGVRKIETVIMPSLPTTTDDIYIQVTSTERLDLLAKQFYDDITAWPVIAAANGIGKGTLFIKPGTILRIPNKTNFQAKIEQKNNNR